MTNAEILSHIDHTVLKPDAKWESVAQICTEAMQYHTASVCIPPCWVKTAREAFPQLNICTVIGFPLGYQTASVKAAETKQAIEDGADEIDMVINVSALKSGDSETVLREMRLVRAACPDAVLKVIIETCLLTESEKILCCKLVTEAGADYIKTSTGFGSAGAQLEDIALFRKHIGSDVKIKAAGGIRTREQMEAFLNAGCDRIGCSAAKILFDGV
ncbi:MAG: deoxyribose-phosphate aldolase [Oscillospiraceae bacterium]|nr:deoxyribose-phosphate aldolase [Oscillospiraceae bacterium]